MQNRATMRGSFLRRRILLAAALGMVAGVWLVSADAARAEGRAGEAKRVPAEVSVTGPSLEQVFAQRRALHAEVMSILPEEVGQYPVRVELTGRDRALLAQPHDVGGRVPLRIGLVKAVSPKLEVNGAFKRGVVEETAGGDLVWATTIRSPGAQAIRVQVTDFSLPPNGELFFFAEDGAIDGPYAGKGRNGTGEFWTRSIASDTGILILRLTAPVSEEDRRNVSFVVSAVGHINGRRPLRPDTQSHDDWPCSDNAPCVVDANCVNGTPADVAKDAIAKMEWIQGIFINTCTGGLIADTDGSTERPLFLTANHCLSKNNSNLETFFFYTTDSCNGTCPDSLVTGGDPPPADTVGVTLLATGSEGDFSLFELNQLPPSGTVYLGWNNTSVAFSGGVPLYRISNPNFGPQAYSEHAVDASIGTCLNADRGAWIYSDDVVGATMGGSSGSPVVNANSEIVGQLTGCCAVGGGDCGDVCNANNHTLDGALAFYFDQVASILDPDGGGTGCSSDADCASGEICCSSACVVPACSSDADCDDGDSCTTDTCSNGGTCSASCSNSEPPCQGGDGCCPSGCDSSNDSDCPSCGGNKAPCSSNADCCSGNCRNGTCRGG